MAATKETETQKTARLKALRLERDKNKPKLPNLYEYPDQLYECDSEMKFGKYKGKIISDIMVEDIGYITWLLENIKNFHLSDHAEAIYLELTDPRRPQKSRRRW